MAQTTDLPKGEMEGKSEENDTSESTLKNAEIPSETPDSKDGEALTAFPGESTALEKTASESTGKEVKDAAPSGSESAVGNGATDQAQGIPTLCSTAV